MYNPSYIQSQSYENQANGECVNGNYDMAYKLYVKAIEQLMGLTKSQYVGAREKELVMKRIEGLLSAGESAKKMALKVKEYQEKLNSGSVSNKKKTKKFGYYDNVKKVKKNKSDDNNNHDTGKKLYGSTSTSQTNKTSSSSSKNSSDPKKKTNISTVSKSTNKKKKVYDRLSSSSSKNKEKERKRGSGSGISENGSKKKKKKISVTKTSPIKKGKKINRFDRLSQPKNSNSKRSRSRDRSKGCNNTGQKKGKIKRVYPNPISTFTKLCCETKAGNENLNRIAKLISSGSFDVGVSDHKYGLHFAAFNGQFEVVKYLINTSLFDLNLLYHGLSVYKYPEDKIMRLAIKVFELLRKELSNIIGLGKVKEYLYSLANKIILDKKREMMGITKHYEPTYDIVFTGNPGTGKTSIARLIAKLFNILKIIPEEKLIECQRADLVAGYIGQTATKTAQKIQEAMGGVLFIDEAYRLSQQHSEGGKDFGKEAIEEIMKAMNATGDRSKSVIIIFAGYKKEMEEFIKTNPGIFRRIAYNMHFDDYTPFDIAKIFMIKIEKSEYKMENGINEKWVALVIEKLSEQSLRSKMNGGLAEKLLQYSVSILNSTLSLDDSGETLITIKKNHIINAMKKHFSGKTL